MKHSDNNLMCNVNRTILEENIPYCRLIHVYYSDRVTILDNIDKKQYNNSRTKI